VVVISSRSANKSFISLLPHACNKYDTLQLLSFSRIYIHRSYAAYIKISLTEWSLHN